MNAVVTNTSLLPVLGQRMGKFYQVVGQNNLRNKERELGKEKNPLIKFFH